IRSRATDVFNARNGTSRHVIATLFSRTIPNNSLQKCDETRPHQTTQMETSPPASMLQIQLFHHFSTEVMSSFNNHSQESTALSDIFIQKGLSTPYLMNEILALAALHLGLVHPSQKEYYHYHATQLQTHAISLFNSTIGDIDEEACIPAFLFSSILGSHVLCKTLRFREEDELSAFLTKFVQYASVHRGVRTVAGRSWRTLNQPSLKSLVQRSSLAANPQRCEIRSGLLQRIKAAKLGSIVTEHYTQTVELLRFETESPGEGIQNVNCTAVIAWTVQVPAEYFDHLALGRPEALVILAHWAVMLNYHRDFWVFGDGGDFLIRSITEYLGPEWETWLAWPKGCLQRDSVEAI
ncbi:hypothetical protein BO71DRAFT_329466, partial [Aspergillus ellipticus CBS 707.79]